MAYTVEIKQNTPDSHQTSPGWLLTFISWPDRDTFRNATLIGMKKPLIVENDCTSLAVSDSKGSANSQMQCVLSGAHINYSTRIVPGDYVVVNIKQYADQLQPLIAKASKFQELNGYNDGFKGLFKVQSVRRAISVQPGGIKSVSYHITARAFTELNNVLYFNPYIQIKDPNNSGSFMFSDLSDQMAELNRGKGIKNCQDIIVLLLKLSVGKNFNKDITSLKDGTLTSPNRGFLLPTQVGNVIGRKNATYASDLFNITKGLQSYTLTAGVAPSVGLNPDHGLSADLSILTTNEPIVGYAILKGEMWNQVTAWSLMMQYLNTTINEMYTTHRVGVDGKVYPTIVIRQKPFSSNYFAAKYRNIKVTRFLDLPRWKIDTNIIQSMDLGRDDVARVNFVQVFGTSQTMSGQGGMINQIQEGNWQIDGKDVSRHGLRPIIENSNHDYLGEDGVSMKMSHAPDWAAIVGDWLIGGHLKENGTVVCYGIEEPIPVGDNLQIGEYVYHIESVQHQCSVSISGVKSFRTAIQLSNGVSSKASLTNINYAEMTYEQATELLAHDPYGQGTLPGITDVEEVSGRIGGEL